MISGEYIIKVTCDFCRFKQSFIAANEMAAQGRRRNAGWVKAGGQDMCPECKLKAKTVRRDK